MSKDGYFMGKRKIEITEDNLGELLAALRYNAHLNVLEAAYIGDCAASSIHKWEHNITSPQLSTVLRLCNIYDAKLYLEYEERRPGC